MSIHLRYRGDFICAFMSAAIYEIFALPLLVRGDIAADVGCIATYGENLRRYKRNLITRCSHAYAKTAASYCAVEISSSRCC